MPNQKYRFLAAFSWTVAITVLSLISLGNVGGSLHIPYKDKMVHFVFYFVFTLLWFSVLGAALRNKKSSLYVFLAAVSYGLLMELCQSLFTQDRTADILDALANTLGAFTGLWWIRSRFLKKTKI